MKPLRSHPNPLLVDKPWPPTVQTAHPWYRLIRRILQCCGMLGVKVRIFNRHYEPPHGGVVYISNHQSFFDPVLVGIALQRPMNYMARDTLFNNHLFRFLISSLNAFPLKRNTADTTALKEAMRRLKKGGQVTVFPEGTRTGDGSIGDFLPGFAILSRRAAEWTVPVVIDGAFDVWPKQSAFPGPTGEIVLCYGEPMHRQEVRNYPGVEFVNHIRQRILSLQDDVRRRRGLHRFEYSGSPASAPASSAIASDNR